MVSFITLFIEFNIWDVVDILLVAYLLFELYNLLKGTAAINILFGIVAVYLAWKLVSALEMELLSEIFGAFISVGFIALIVVFQPEIRKFLLMVGTPGFRNVGKKRRFLLWKLDFGKTNDINVDPVIMACSKFSESKTGALIVFANKIGLDQYAQTGEKMDAVISDQLLMNIFFKNSPLHDGAVIIQNNKINAARCLLPVSVSQRIPAHLGLRHRAAAGVTENSDALALIVSEETGHISYAFKGIIHPPVKANELKNIITSHLH
ncbi:MAG: diadenylate cyclase CdaA [Bacteroidales bacterium]|nr:diadenylate cyclase CdaA [Bacteroidales bacterium]